MLLYKNITAEIKSFQYKLATAFTGTFLNWLESAKTDATKTKRIAQAVGALAMNLKLPEMMRMNKKMALL